jgi:hypothetical protein
MVRTILYIVNLLKYSNLIGIDNICALLYIMFTYGEYFI